MAIYAISSLILHFSAGYPGEKPLAGISAVDHFSQPDVAIADRGDYYVIGQGHGALLFNPSVTLFADADIYSIVLLDASAVTPASLAAQ